MHIFLQIFLRMLLVFDNPILLNFFLSYEDTFLWKNTIVKTINSSMIAV